MIKLIHTSDWHLGHQLYNYDREAEQCAMLSQIEDLVRAEQPDALLISGDVFHTAQPSAAIQKIFADALTRIHAACPAMHTVVTAGNHDSGAKHEIFRSPWEALHVHVVGHVDRDRPEEHLIRIPGKGLILAVPYVNARFVPPGFYQGLLDRAQQENPEGLPLVLMAHTTVNGLDWTGHEGATDRSVGGIDALALEDLGSGYDYLALGHIHRPQWVRGGQGRVRYSGTPLPVSFDENFTHTVSVVELPAAGERPCLREVEIDNPYPLITLPLQDAAPWEDLKPLLTDFRPPRKDSYLRLNVWVEDHIPATVQAEARQLAQACGCRLCLINPVREAREGRARNALTVQELQQEAPETLAKRFVEGRGGSWDAELSALFQEVVAQVEEADRAQ